MQHKGWAQIQDRYYRTIPNCKKTGTNWASRLQFELWSFVWDMWTHRQEVRYELPTADDIVILDEAKLAISSELSIGIGTLPPLYRIYFTTTEERLFDKTPTDIRVWLRLIRGARESLHIYSNDIFSFNGPHRIWLGLTCRLTNRSQNPASTPTSPLNTTTTPTFDNDLSTNGGISL